MSIHVPNGAPVERPLDYPMFNNPVEGKLTGQDHWRLVQYAQGSLFEDTSAVYTDEQGRKYTHLYMVPTCGGSTYVGLEIIVATPVHLIGSIAYNIIRLVLVPLYLLLRLPYDLWVREKKDISEVLSERMREIGEQMLFCLKNIVRSPYYAACVWVGGFYCLFDPFNGRKMVGQFERAWNHGMTRDQSIWIAACFMNLGMQKEYKFEGGGSPKDLGKHAFYVAGCCQPAARVIYGTDASTEAIQAMIKIHGENKTLPKDKKKPIVKPVAVTWTKSDGNGGSSWKEAKFVGAFALDGGCNFLPKGCKV